MAGLDPSIGLSALRAAQRGLEVVGHNLANATTPGYSRQAIELRTLRPEDRPRVGQVGTGVDVVAVRRSVDMLLRGRMLEADAQNGMASASAGRLRELEALVSRTDEGGLAPLLGRVSAAAAAMAANPEDPVARAGFVSDLRALGSGLAGTRASVEALRRDVGTEISARVADLQSTLSEVAALDASIVSARTSGQSPNDLLDRRDVLLRDLSRELGIRALDRSDGSVTVTLGGEVIVSAGKVAPMGTTVDANGVTRVTVRSRVTDLTGGEVAGLQRAQQESQDVLGQLDGLARGLVLELNRLDSTGVPGGGPKASWVSSIPVQDVNLSGDPRDDPLVLAGLPIPPGSGPSTIVVNVTDLATGARTESRVTFDPRVQSLSDLATALGGVTDVTATAGPDGTLSLVAAPGKGIDFADRSGGVSDAQGVLAALGFSRLVTGHDASDVQVSGAIQSSPASIAAGLSPGAGDGRNATRMAELETTPLAALAGATPIQFASGLVSQVGRAAREAQGLETAAQGALSVLEGRREVASGVSLEDEASDLLRFERAFQAATKYLQVLDNLSQELLQLVAR